MIVALAGGVGGARLAQGLVQVLDPAELTIAVNVGDDFEHLGLAISPDLDTVMYTLAGVHNTATGWGRADETWHFMDTLERLGGETWFRLGDHDLAVHVERTRRLAGGEPLSSITADFCSRFGIRHAVVPATDQRLRTRVRTDAGEIAFQDYFVRRRAQPAVLGLHFDGATAAGPAPALAALLASDDVKGVVICPSNPWLSVDPILAVAAIAGSIDALRFPVVAVSPIIAGNAVKGPAAKIMRELGVGSDALGVVAHYGKRVAGWVIDQRDVGLAAAIEARGHRVCVTETLMTGPDVARRLATIALELVGSLRRA